MKRVLVVDDEPMIRWSIEQTLGAAGYQVVGAETAAQGWILLQRLHPALVFLDVRLPDGNGLSLLQAIRAQHEPTPAVIVMTAYEETCPAAEALHLGAYAYLRKPFDFDQLASIAGQVLQGSGRTVKRGN